MIFAFSLKRAVMRDVALLSQVGVKVVLVHGGAEPYRACANLRAFLWWAAA